MKVSLNLSNFQYYSPKQITADRSAKTSLNSAGRNRNSINISCNYNNLINFTSNNFRTDKLEGLSCPFCEHMMLATSQAAEFVSLVEDLRDKDLIKALEKYENDKNISDCGSGKTIYRPIEQDIVEILKQLASKHQDANIKKLAVLGDQLLRLKKHKVPISASEDVQRWFQSAASKKTSSKNIAEKLISPSKITVEHLVPKSKKGGNAKSNFICDCSNCNAERDTLDFYTWMKKYPNLKENIEQQLEDIKQLIEKDQLPLCYRDYIKQVIGTIFKISKGELELDYPKQFDEFEENVDNIIQKRKEIVENLRQAQKDYKIEMQQNYQKIEELKQMEEKKAYTQELEELLESTYRLSEIVENNEEVLKNLRFFDSIKQSKFERITAEFY